MTLHPRATEFGCDEGWNGHSKPQPKTSEGNTPQRRRCENPVRRHDADCPECYIRHRSSGNASHDTQLRRDPLPDPNGRAASLGPDSFSPVELNRSLALNSLTGPPAVKVPGPNFWLSPLVYLVPWLTRSRALSYTSVPASRPRSAHSRALSVTRPYWSDRK